MFLFWQISYCLEFENILMWFIVNVQFTFLIWVIQVSWWQIFKNRIKTSILWKNADLSQLELLSECHCLTWFCWYFINLSDLQISHFYILFFNIHFFFLSVSSSKILCFLSNKILKLIFWDKISYLSFYSLQNQENVRKIEFLLSKLEFICLLAIECVTV